MDDIRHGIIDQLRNGVVIPASPLALTPERKFDEFRQRVLMRYYLDAGAGGIAVGVHFTQFEIRAPGIDLYEPVLRTCSEVVDKFSLETDRAIIKIAGIDGRKAAAIKQAVTARKLGYDFGMVSLSAFKGCMEQEMLQHMKEISMIMPLFGFYLLTGVGGVSLSYRFWRELVEMENIYGIKIAPFNRYCTLDVLRAVAQSGKEDRITLYTGNDDSIIYDLITPFKFNTSNGERTQRIRGGILGQWAVWTKRAVELLDEVHDLVDNGKPVPTEMLTRSAELTDANAAIFDSAHHYAGSIPGVNEILRRQGLFTNVLTLKPDEVLMPGQAEEIERVCRAYPHLTDDDFVRANLEKWMQEG
jgi:hypothetical protein